METLHSPTPPGRHTAAELIALAAWIDQQLSDETADRQQIAENAAVKIRAITLRMPDAELARPSTADAGQRVTAAREFLTGARKRRVGELPPSLLMREDAELRRQLGHVLGYLGEVVVLDSDQLEVLGRALPDAIGYTDPPLHCEACDALPGDELCAECTAGLAAAGFYLGLARGLGIEVDR